MARGLQVTVLVRSGPLAARMSEYLIAEMNHTPDVDVRYDVQVVAGSGEGRLEYIDLKSRSAGEVEPMPAAAVFVLIGAMPCNKKASRGHRTGQVGLRLGWRPLSYLEGRDRFKPRARRTDNGR